MATPEQEGPFSQLIEYAVEPREQAGLISALIERDQRYTASYPGFLEARVQASDDGLRVLHQVLWRSRPCGEQACRNVEAADLDLGLMLRRFRVRSATFGSFKVMGQVAPRGAA
ncbi:antibiotic biosynthesis monooxygenase [Pseudomonas sp. v388]|uniref:antibiotic biosynthesis monooxygenase n=1 Tax=Pseudomonas sp. v388 TaxID=2479849 RepID=UPI000F79F52F|nr:antibiotic biosynthesis monooxygenase [Pseudomonas sp. v388]RRV05751.1 antibiotic biosynthesis monooxygenase [Pseudomonas sp. v388]